MPEFRCDVIKAVTLSIKSHNLGTDPLPIENNVKFTLSEAQVRLDRYWVIPATIGAPILNSTKKVAKSRTKKTEPTLLKDESV